jgi:hypothetical protein
MAIKDWKKVEDNKSGIVFKDRKNEANFIIIENPKFYKRKIWIIYINESSNNYRFKTKSQALAFAREYMRKN